VTTARRLEINQSWPIWEQAHQFELGTILNSTITDLLVPDEVGALGVHHVGCWECDLSDNSLIWSGGVYDIFGLPRGASITRGETVQFYSERSRAAMERLRAHAIKHKRGFTLDAEIRPAIGGVRWMRLIGAPVIEGARVTRLHGVKLII